MKVVTIHELNLWIMKEAIGSRIGTRDPPLFSPEGAFMIYKIRARQSKTEASIRETVSKVGAPLRDEFGIPDASGDHLTLEDAGKVAEDMGFPGLVTPAKPDSDDPQPAYGGEGKAKKETAQQKREKRLKQWLDEQGIPEDRRHPLELFTLRDIYNALFDFPEFRSDHGAGLPIEFSTFDRKFWQQQDIAKLPDLGRKGDY